MHTNNNLKSRFGMKCNIDRYITLPFPLHETNFTWMVDMCMVIWHVYIKAGDKDTTAILHLEFKNVVLFFVVPITVLCCNEAENCRNFHFIITLKYIKVPYSDKDEHCNLPLDLHLPGNFLLQEKAGDWCTVDSVADDLLHNFYYRWSTKTSRTIQLEEDLRMTNQAGFKQAKVRMG